MTLSGFLIGGAVPAICLGTVFMRVSAGAVAIALAVAHRVARPLALPSSADRGLTEPEHTLKSGERR